MTGRLQRFDVQYLRDFRAPITVNPSAMPAEEAEAPPPPPVYSETELASARDVAKKLGYAEGFEAGIQQANTEAHAKARDLAHALERIGEQLTQLLASHQQLIDQQSSELSELVLMIARKVAGEALDARGTETVRALVARCLPAVFTKPKIAIELAPTMLRDAEEMLREHLAQAGYEGEIEFRAIAEMAESDIRISWSNGEASRTTASLWHDIEALLQQAPLTPTLPQNHEGETNG